MSLRAKIEAVVYAAEEPVTLAQLAALFADEALAWKREHEKGLSEPDESATGIVEQEFLPASLGPVDEVVLEAQILPLAATPPGGNEPAPDEVVGFEPEEATPENAASSDEAEVKRIARQRDREVREILRALLDELVTEYEQSDRGIEIREIAGGYRIGTKPEYHDSVRSFVKSLKPPMKLSLQALETLAVIAYKQPVTAPEVSEIRGVDTSGVLGGLITRKLITTAGRKQVIGRPILYKTTKEFLLRFGLKDVSELPSIEEFEKMAGDLTDPDVNSDIENGTATNTELPFHEVDASELDVATHDSVESDIPATGAGVAVEPPPPAGSDPEPTPNNTPQQEVAEVIHSVSKTVPAQEEK